MSERMEQCSTSSLSTRDWAQLLILWTRNKPVIYGNLTLPAFITVVHAASNRGCLYCGWRGFELMALVITEVKGDECHVETFAGPVRFARAWAKLVRGRYKHIFHVRPNNTKRIY